MRECVGRVVSRYHGEDLEHAVQTVNGGGPLGLLAADAAAGVPGFARRGDVRKHLYTHGLYKPVRVRNALRHWLIFN